MTAVQIIIVIIPIVGIIMGGMIIFFYLLWRHKQIMLQIKMNTYRPPIFNVQLFCLLLGIILIAIGFVLSILFYLIEHLSYILLGGLIPFALGVGLCIFYTKQSTSQPSKPPCITA